MSTNRNFKRGASRQEDFLRFLVMNHIIDPADLPTPDDTDTDDFDPIPIEGKPISEEIIEERR